jgi:hypothetical protein
MLEKDLLLELSHVEEEQVRWCLSAVADAAVFFSESTGCKCDLSLLVKYPAAGAGAGRRGAGGAASSSRPSRFRQVLLLVVMCLHAFLVLLELKPEEQEQLGGACMRCTVLKSFVIQPLSRRHFLVCMAVHMAAAQASSLPSYEAACCCDYAA